MRPREMFRCMQCQRIVQRPPGGLALECWTCMSKGASDEMRLWKRDAVRDGGNYQ